MAETCPGCGHGGRDLTYRDYAGFLLCGPCGALTEEMERDPQFLSNPRFDTRPGESPQEWMRRLQEQSHA